MINKKKLFLAALILSTIYSGYKDRLIDVVVGKINGEPTLRSPLARGEKPSQTEAGVANLKETNGPVSAFKNLLGKILGSESKSLNQNRRYEIFGFLPFWTLDKRIHFRYETLTTIAYFGLDTDSGGNFIKIRDNGKTDGAWAGWLSDEMTEVINQAKKNRIKVMLTIKGFDNETIEKLLACSKCRTNLVNNALTEVRERGANGVNIDFEYVGTPDENTIFRFTQLVKDFVDIFHDEIPGAHVSVSTYAKSAAERKIHDIRNLATIADSIFIMGYDFFRPVSIYAGPVAPLDGAEKYGYDLKTSISDYLKVAPAGKIILGIPYYGYDWPVEKNEPNAKTLEGSEEKGYPNMSSYVNSQYDPNNKDAIRGWDNEAQVPFYSWFDKERNVWRQTYYDDVRSLSLKYDFIKEKKLRGVGIWALGYDGSYPELWDLLENKFSKP